MSARVFDQNVSARAGVALLWIVGTIFIMIAMRVVLRGAPLADDYRGCVYVPQRGMARAMARTLEVNGVVRPARFIELALIGSLCRRVPFGLLILVPLGLTFGVAFQLRGLLRDLLIPAPWPELGTAVWLLQPLGLESALWPSALHVPLGLTLVLVAARLYRRRLFLAAVPVGLAAYLSVEQAILALPAIAFLVSAPKHRRTALLLAGLTSFAVLAAFSMWPGSAPRVPTTIVDILLNPFRAPTAYVRFAMTALGLHSIPMAIAWAFPQSIGVLAAGTLAGSIIAPRLLRQSPPPPAPNAADVKRFAAIIATLTVLLNLPMALVYPHTVSGRVFAPTWLMLAASAALVGSRLEWRRFRLAGSVAGFLAGAAMLSLALSASVRVRTADFAEAAYRWLGERVSANGVIAICDVRRAAIPYAPAGDFHTSEFLGASPELGIAYYAGVTTEIRRGGQYWRSRCPDVQGADTVISFDQLIADHLR